MSTRSSRGRDIYGAKGSPALADTRTEGKSTSAPSTQNVDETNSPRLRGKNGTATDLRLPTLLGYQPSMRLYRLSVDKTQNNSSGLNLI